MCALWLTNQWARATSDACFTCSFACVCVCVLPRWDRSAPSHLYPCDYKWSDAGKIIALMCAHVDGLLVAHSIKGSAAKTVLDKFSVGKIEEGRFRYCGRCLPRTRTAPCASISRATQKDKPVWQVRKTWLWLSSEWTAEDAQSGQRQRCRTPGTRAKSLSWRSNGLYSSKFSERQARYMKYSLKSCNLLQRWLEMTGVAWPDDCELLRRKFREWTNQVTRVQCPLIWSHESHEALRLWSEQVCRATLQ